MSDQPDGDRRVEELLEILAQFRADSWTSRATPSPRGDGLDRVIDALNQLGAETMARRAATEQQFEAILEMIMSMLALDFTQKAPVLGDGTAIDALAFGLNNVSDELAGSMVSRAYVDNILASMLDALIVLDADGTIRTANRAAAQLFGYAENELTGQPFTTILCEEAFVPRLHDALQSRAVLSNAETLYQSRDGRSIPLALSASPMVDPAGEMNGMVCVVRDITERKQAEEAMRQSLRQAETIRAQAEALAELSTPLIPINDQVMVMPLIGTVDSRRAQQVMETLLTGIAESHAQVAILDITGVPIVDTQVANALVRAAQAVKLLGAQVILSGIRPEVAQILVSLGIDLSGIVTRSTLQSGIAFAIRQP